MSGNQRPAPRADRRQESRACLLVRASGLLCAVPSEDVERIAAPEDVSGDLTFDLESAPGGSRPRLRAGGRSYVAATVPGHDGTAPERAWVLMRSSASRPAMALRCESCVAIARIPGAAIEPMPRGAFRQGTRAVPAAFDVAATGLRHELAVGVGYILDLDALHAMATATRVS